MYWIAHTGENIDWVINLDKAERATIELPGDQCGDVLANKQFYKIVDGKCVLRDDTGEIIRKATLENKLINLKKERGLRIDPVLFGPHVRTRRIDFKTKTLQITVPYKVWLSRWFELRK